MTTLGRASFLAGSSGFFAADVEVFVLNEENVGLSKLLSDAQQQTISTFVGRPMTDFELCYRASEHGYNGYAFHKKCDFKSPTFSVIRTATGMIL